MLLSSAGLVRLASPDGWDGMTVLSSDRPRPLRLAFQPATFMSLEQEVRLKHRLDRQEAKINEFQQLEELADTIKISLS